MLLSQETAYSSSQHTLTSTATCVAPSIAASMMSLTAQQTSASSEQSHKLFMAHPFHASAIRHPSTDRWRHSAQLPANAASPEQHRSISSTAQAADSMAKDKTDLNAGAATAAAAQTMQQQPSKHGLQAAPQVAKVLGFAGRPLRLFSGASSTRQLEQKSSSDPHCIKSITPPARNPCQIRSPELTAADASMSMATGSERCCFCEADGQKQKSNQEGVAAQGLSHFLHWRLPLHSTCRSCQQILWQAPHCCS